MIRLCKDNVAGATGGLPARAERLFDEDCIATVIREPEVPERESNHENPPGGSANSQAEHAEWLRSTIVDTEKARNQLLAAEMRWSWSRLATFAVAAGGWYPVANWTVLAWAMVAGGIIAFVYSVRRHLAAKARRELEDRRLTVLHETRQRLGGNVVLVRNRTVQHDDALATAACPSRCDDAPSFELTDQERDDLDLYAGPVGVFGLLNRTSTFLGASRLRDWIDRPLLAASPIERRQGAVCWLDEHASERIRILAGVAVLRGQDRRFADLVRAIDDAQPWPGRAKSLALRVWSVLTAGLVGVSLWRIGAGSYVWVSMLLLLALCNGAMYAVQRRRLTAALHAWQSLAIVSRDCEHAFAQADGALRDPSKPEALADIRDGIHYSTTAPALRGLAKTVAWSESGGFLHVLFNLYFFFDLHVIEAILKHAAPNREALLNGFGALADLESITSLACFAYEQPLACYPQLSATRTIDMVDAAHPLIAPDRMVTNNVHLDATTHIWIVTGSNMSGKSTLLRLIGLNCVLAQIGSAAVARSMTWSPITLVTDLQVRDSLAADESYFRAEVRHLRRMVVPENTSMPLLGLMDEPFRGTNSVEQVGAGLGVVSYLMTTGNFFVIATHSPELTALANGKTTVNRHFRDDIREGKIVFDYRLREGAAPTRNALRILEQEGYPAEVLREAHAFVERADEAPGTHVSEAKPVVSTKSD